MVVEPAAVSRPRWQMRSPEASPSPEISMLLSTRVWHRANRVDAIGAAAICLHVALARSADAQASPPAFVTSSEYVTTRDGTRLAVDVHLPSSRAAGERLPALLEL